MPIFSRSVSLCIGSGSVRFVPPKTNELGGYCAAEDHETRPTLADIAADVSWIGSVGDSVLAYADGLKVLTD
jgi:hypothetical protein